MDVFSNLSVADLNKLEKVLLSLLQYNVGLHASLYAKYYFELRELSDLDDTIFPIRPLDRNSAERAEKRCEGGARRTHKRLSADALLLN